MRVFVAVEPPVEAVEDLEEFLEVRRDAGSQLRWSPPGQWHVTLAFMGSAPERVLDDLLEGVAGVAERTVRFDLTVEGGGCFPDVTRARVLWAGIRDGEPLVPLARGVRSACALAGAAPEGGPFQPHVTLARFPRPTDATRWLRVLETYAGPSWDVGWVTVYASHLPRERGHRPRHEVLARLPLAT